MKTRNTHKLKSIFSIIINLHHQIPLTVKILKCYRKVICSGIVLGYYQWVFKVVNLLFEIPDIPI